MNELILGQSAAWRRPVIVPGRLRPRHGYVLGKSGKGKSALLHRLIHQDARRRHATVLFDAGDLARDVLEALPDGALSRVSIFSVEQPIPYNPFLRRRGEPGRLENELFALIDQVTAELSSTPPLSARMKRLLAAAIETAIAEPSPSFTSLATILLEKRAELRAALQLREDEFATTWEAVIDRLSQFLRDRRIRRVICAGHELDFGRIIDEERILLVSLAGLEPALRRFLGTLLFHALQATVLERREADRRPVAVYVDEFQDYLASRYAVANFQTLFAQGRRYAIGITVGHQDFGTVPEALLHTIHGNAAVLVAFGCGPDEARTMSEVFAGEWPPEAIAVLSDYEVVARIGEGMHHFTTYPPPSKVRRVAVDTIAGPVEEPPDPFSITLHTDERNSPKPRARTPRRRDSSAAA